MENRCHVQDIEDHCKDCTDSSECRYGQPDGPEDYINECECDMKPQLDLKNIHEFANIICDMYDEYYNQIIRTHAVLKEQINIITSPTHGMAPVRLEEIEAYSVALANFITLNHSIVYIVEETRKSGRVQEAQKELQSIRDQLSKYSTKE